MSARLRCLGRRFLPLALLVSISCNGLAEDPPTTISSWRAVLRESGAPSLLVRPVSPVSAKSQEQILEQAGSRALEFLARYAADLGSEASRESFTVARVDAGDRGGARVRLHTQLGSLPIESGDVLVIFSASGEIRAVSGTVPKIALRPFDERLSPDRVSTTAIHAVRAERPEALIEIAQAPQRVAVPMDNGSLRAAWKVTVSGADDDAPIRRTVFIDSTSGAVFHQREGLEAIGTEGSGLGFLGRRRRLAIELGRDGTYELRDDRRRLRTYTAGSTFSTGLLLRSQHRDEWDTGVFGAGAAVDAHAHGALVMDYLAATFGRTSLDEDGDFVRLVVHAGPKYRNAYWDGQRAVFGDGDDTLAPLSTGLDVVAHELAHALTQSDSALIYEGQPGALNESFSDVFACWVELQHQTGNWTIGEQLGLDPMRSLTDPHRTGHPAHMSEYRYLPLTPEYDMGGVHVNSTIPSHAAYLVAVGGAPLGRLFVPGIGIEKMRAIWWHAMRTYVGPRSDFADFAEATRAAAEDLFGDGDEAIAVETAWHAVGVFGSSRFVEGRQ